MEAVYFGSPYSGPARAYFVERLDVQAYLVALSRPCLFQQRPWYQADTASWLPRFRSPAVTSHLIVAAPPAYDLVALGTHTVVLPASPEGRLLDWTPLHAIGIGSDFNPVLALCMFMGGWGPCDPLGLLPEALALGWVID